jgi:uncharacterized membrane protein YkgB
VTRLPALEPEQARPKAKEALDDLQKAIGAGISIAGSGTIILRIGLVLVLLLIGIVKFTPQEANAIQIYISPSPLFAWLNLFLNHQQLSDIFGTFEISAGILIATRPLLPIASAVGSAIAIGIFLSTISFLFTTHGVWMPHHGFPTLDRVGEFLLKDVTLLGAAVYTFGEALQASSKPRQH